MFVVFFYPGLILGLTIGLLTMGFRLTHQTSGYMNLGYVVNIGVGMMLGFIGTQLLGVRPILGAPFAFLSTGFFNVIVYRVFFRRMERLEYSETLISLFGLVFMFLGVELITIATYLVRSWYPLKYPLHYRGPLYEPIGLALLVITVGYVWERTSIGIKFKAVAENQNLLEICGTNSTNIKTLAWFVAGGLAGIAGIISPYLYKGEFARDVGLYYMPVFIGAVLSEKKAPWVAGLVGSLVGYMQLIIMVNGQANIGVWFPNFREPITAFVLAIILYMKDRKFSIHALFNKRG